MLTLKKIYLAERFKSLLNGAGEVVDNLNNINNIFIFYFWRYDCSEHIFGTLDYCLHFMSRTPTMSEEKVKNGLHISDSLKQPLIWF